MPRDSRIYLEDILTAASWIRSYVAGLTREQFGSDRKTVDAVVRNLEVIGEAVKGSRRTCATEQRMSNGRRSRASATS
jgi:uncharacterized protein with HEPN domain